MPPATPPRRRRGRSPGAPADYDRDPLFWFLQLHQAVERGDFPAAQRATEALAGLGVQVRWGRPRGGPAAPGGGRHAG